MGTDLDHGQINQWQRMKRSKKKVTCSVRRVHSEASLWNGVEKSNHFVVIA